MSTDQEKLIKAYFKNLADESAPPCPVKTPKTVHGGLIVLLVLMCSCAFTFLSPGSEAVNKGIVKAGTLIESNIRVLGTSNFK